MVSQHETERFTEVFNREPLTSAIVVIKCAVGLLIVAGLAVVGAQSDTADAPAATASQSRSHG
jgi:hypothetical protein